MQAEQQGAAAPSDAELLAFRRKHADLCLDDLLRAALARWGQPTPPAVVEPRMPVGNATLERLREWERDGELLERVWGTLVDQETEIGQLRAAARAPADSGAAPAGGVADGWKWAPEEPTLQMGWAYLDAARESEPLRTHTFNHAGYRAMLAAAPTPPAQAADSVLEESHHVR